MSTKVTDILKKVSSTPVEHPHISLEFFPPKTELGYANLQSRISRMSKSLEPSFVSITYGAGGSTSNASLQLAQYCQVELNLTTVLHLTCTNFEDPKLLIKVLEECKQMGIRNLLALRGDPPRNEEYFATQESQISEEKVEFQHANQLVKFIKEKFEDYFCVGVAAYPECHPESKDQETDIKYLKLKLDAGADFIFTQFFFDTERYLKWYDLVRTSGISVPIIPTFMLLQNYNAFRRLINLTKVSVPDDIFVELDKIRHDDAAVKALGVELTSKSIKQILSKIGQQGLNACHFCTLNLEKSVVSVVNNLGWSQIESTSKADNVSGDEGRKILEKQAINHNLMNWDEFPNGRFGDAASPAYGEIDGYGPGLQVRPDQALQIWGRPTSIEDISQLCLRFLNHTLDVLPWCDAFDWDVEIEPLLPYLKTLNSNGFFTLASQPAFDSVPSNHPEFGWGPTIKKDAVGYLYQKAFLEFMVPKSKLQILTQHFDKSDGRFTYMVVDSDGKFQSNLILNSNSQLSSTTVTWGIFNRREVVQPTKIEPNSFVAFASELFIKLTAWKHLFDSKDISHKVIGQLAKEYVLVNVIDNEFKGEVEKLFKELTQILNLY